MQFSVGSSPVRSISSWVLLVTFGGLTACGSDDDGTQHGAGGTGSAGAPSGSAGRTGVAGSVAPPSAGSAGVNSAAGAVNGGSAGISGAGTSAGGTDTPSGGTSGASDGGAAGKAGSNNNGGTSTAGSGVGGSSAGSGTAGAGGKAPTGPTGNTNLSGLIGFATVPGYGVMTTVGAGNGASIVTVSSYADFVAAVGDSMPRIVQVNGRITGSGPMVDVGSNKTIIGMGTSATLDGFGLDINGWTPREVEEFGTDVCEPESMDEFPRVSNVVVRNLTFVNSPDDSVNIQCYSHHVWVDHCTFNAATDGSLDVKRGSDLVTVSWNRFVSTDKTMLLGHSEDNGEQDRGFLRVTYHHNWFDDTATRTPRVRFGFAHVFNNYLNSSDYFLGLGIEAKIYAEGNFVEKAKTLTQTFTESAGYHLTWAASNTYDRATITRANDSSSVMKDWLDADGSVAAPSAYTYTVEAASAIQSTVKNGAGAGKI